MNNKGFAITGVLYSVLLIFVVMITTLLFNLQNRKTILDELKIDAINAVESDNNYEYLLGEINKLKSQVGTTDISGLGDGTVSGIIEEINDDLNELKPTKIIVYAMPSPNNYIAFPKPTNAKTVKVTKIAAVGYGIDRLSESTYYAEDEVSMAYVVPNDMQGYYCEIHLELTY